MQYVCVRLLFCLAVLILPQSCSPQTSFFGWPLSNSKFTDQINPDKQETKTDLENSNILQIQKQPEMNSAPQPIENANKIPVSPVTANVTSNANISLGKSNS